MDNVEIKDTPKKKIKKSRNLKAERQETKPLDIPQDEGKKSILKTFMEARNEARKKAGLEEAYSKADMDAVK